MPVDSVRSVLLLWLAGWQFSVERLAEAQDTLFRRDRFEIAREVRKALVQYPGESGARRLQQLFPLTATDAERLTALKTDPMTLAQELVERFSPRWLVGWRDITNAANTRTIISSFCPVTAIGHKFLLMFSKLPAQLVVGLMANLNSFVADFVARQKVGGTSLNYFTFRQLAVLPPAAYKNRFMTTTYCDFVSSRSLELIFTADDLALLARDCGYDDQPFRWDEARRFQIRAELDAAYLHAYLGPSDTWQPTPAETRENLASLRAHFPTPKDAAAHLLNSFPLVRVKDEKAHGHYRTRDTILALYEAFTHAHRNQQPWSSPLDPPPGTPARS